MDLISNDQKNECDTARETGQTGSRNEAQGFRYIYNI